MSRVRHPARRAMASARRARPSVDYDDAPSGGNTNDEEGCRFGIDLTKCPAAWLPEATSTVTFTARTYECVPGKGWVYPGPKRKITFRLYDVSSERGICLNKGKSKNPDLWFPEQANVRLSDDRTVDSLCERTILGVPNPPHHHYRVARTKDEVTEATITVRSEDFGAFGFLEATAEDCVGIPPRERGRGIACKGGRCCEGSNRVKIPRDDNGNNIADTAPQDDKGAPPDRDRDAIPTGDGTPGDGLTNYEEYRGFIVLQGPRGAESHVRTDIRDKDIFIRDVAGQGVGYFMASGLTVHFVGPDGLGGPNRREINFNRGFATTGPQHGLRLRNANLGGALLGICYGGPATPRDVTSVVIDPAAHAPPNDIENTRAHELGHGVDVRHHGQLALIRPGRIDPKGGLTSGAVTCVMRYDNYADAWRWPRPLTDYPIPDPEPPGTAFCDTQRGDGPNAPTRRRNNAASVGACQTQIRVNDK